MHKLNEELRIFSTTGTSMGVLNLAIVNPHTHNSIATTDTLWYIDKMDIFIQRSHQCRRHPLLYENLIYDIFCSLATYCTNRKKSMQTENLNYICITYFNKCTDIPTCMCMLCVCEWKCNFFLSHTKGNKKRGDRVFQQKYVNFFQGTLKLYRPNKIRIHRT